LIDSLSSIHPTAEVEPGAIVAAGTSIWNESHVRRDAVIGNSCTLGKNVFIDQGVRIGDHVKIQNNVSVYKGVELDNGVFVGPSAVFTNDLFPRAASQEWRVVPTKIRRGASIGANATVICGVDVGEYAMIGAGAVVTKSVEAHQLVTGNPARHRGWVCFCGTVVSRDAVQPMNLTCVRCGDKNDARSEVQRQRISLVKVIIGPEEQEAVLGVLRSGQLAAGRWVAELEASFASAHQVRHAVAVSSGTTALVAALRAHGIGPGDEVITSPLTFVATLNAILEVGAVARFADITEDMTLDPAMLAGVISPRTKALMPVHLFGLPADMPQIMDIANKHRLAVIEDAAQAHGARVANVPVGTFGTGVFSLYATKNITCGEGGLITTDDDNVAERLQLLRNHGMRERYEYVMAGSNYRMTDLQAAIAAVQTRRLSAITEGRSRNADLLSAGLSGLPGLVLPSTSADRLHVWHQYTIRLTGQGGIDRNQLRKRLDVAGIDSMAYYPKLVHDYPCYDNHAQVIRDATPRARRIVEQVLSLPVHPALTATDIHRVISCVRDALKA
jgi:dTDP-4-amino-4,6-dideoxygalactose transaminase/acetyltransferase-like isoleucine patch superfamily enzyme